jgi:hypothetical protein
MTPIESKVRELSDKLCDAIAEMQKRKTEDKVIVQSIKSYLAGLTDGLDLAEEVRGDELAVTNDLLAEMANDTPLSLDVAEAIVRSSRGAGTTVSTEVLNQAFDVLKKSGIDPAKL